MCDRYIVSNTNTRNCAVRCQRMLDKQRWMRQQAHVREHGGWPNMRQLCGGLDKRWSHGLQRFVSAGYFFRKYLLFCSMFDMLLIPNTNTLHWVFRRERMLNKQRRLPQRAPMHKHGWEPDMRRLCGRLDKQRYHGLRRFVAMDILAIRIHCAVSDILLTAHTQTLNCCSRRERVRRNRHYFHGFGRFCSVVI